MIEKPSRCYFMFKCEAEAQISVLLMIIHRGGMSFETETDINSECNWLYKKVCHAGGWVLGLSIFMDLSFWKKNWRNTSILFDVGRGEGSCLLLWACPASGLLLWQEEWFLGRNNICIRNSHPFIESTSFFFSTPDGAEPLGLMKIKILTSHAGLCPLLCSVTS